MLPARVRVGGGGVARSCVLVDIETYCCADCAVLVYIGWGFCVLEQPCRGTLYPLL